MSKKLLIVTAVSFGLLATSVVIIGVKRYQAEQPGSISCARGKEPQVLAYKDAGKVREFTLYCP
jgi:hypothetical protein